MRSLADEFKTFILRGNLIELAVAIVIGVAFTDLVKAMVDDIFTPLIAAVFGKPDFSALTFTINGSVFKYGDLINKVVAFLSVALVIFFFVIKPTNLLMAKSRRDPPPDPTLRKCPECLESINSSATRCRFCSAAVEPILVTPTASST